MWRLMGMGMEFLVTLLVLGGAGWLVLDRWLGWAPWGLVGGVVMGCVVGMMNMIRTAMRVANRK